MVDFAFPSDNAFDFFGIVARGITLRFLLLGFNAFAFGVSGYP